MFFGMNTDYFTSQSSAEPKAAFYDDDAHAGDIPVPPPSKFSQMPVDFPKYCDNCGTECENWVKFCPACGCKTFSVWIKKPIQVIDNPNLLKRADKNVRKYLLKKRLPVIALCILCIILVATSTTLYINLCTLTKNNEDMRNSISELSKENSQLKTENDTLEQTNSFLRNLNKDLANEIVDYEEILDSLGLG